MRLCLSILTFYKWITSPHDLIGSRKSLKPSRSRPFGHAVIPFPLTCTAETPVGSRIRSDWGSPSGRKSERAPPRPLRQKLGRTHFRMPKSVLLADTDLE